MQTGGDDIGRETERLRDETSRLITLSRKDRQQTESLMRSQLLMSGRSFADTGCSDAERREFGGLVGAVGFEPTTR